MQNKEKEEKLRINPWRIIFIFIGLFLIIEFLFYLTFQFSASDPVWWPLNISFFFYTPVLLGVTILFCVLSITQTFYIVEKSRIVHVKMGKAYEYYFNNIVYIDEEYSKKHKMLLFYTKDGKEYMLAFDKNAVIFEKCLERCNLISREEFIARYKQPKL